MDEAALRQWRTEKRQSLIAQRLALAPETLLTWRRAIDARIVQDFPRLARSVLAFCWPIRNEYDARHVARTLRARGALTALPVVLARNAPLAFRSWHPGVRLARGSLGIPYPVESPQVVPDAVLLPMIGWDMSGFRLGYGGGYFDRTLAALEPRPLVIGVAFEFGRLETIHPGSWDIAMDYVVTERRLLRRQAGALVPQA